MWIAWSSSSIPNVGLGLVPGEYSLIGPAAPTNLEGKTAFTTNLTLELFSSASANWTVFKDFNMTGQFGETKIHEKDVATSGLQSRARELERVACTQSFRVQQLVNAEVQ